MSLTHLRKAFILIFSFSVFSVTVIAQRTIKDTPISFQEQYKSGFSVAIPQVSVPALDMEKIKREDATRVNNNRFAAPVQVNFSLEKDGEWTELKDGGRVWRLQLHSEGALGLFILYKNFYLPNGARLFVYDQNQQQLLGAYSSLNNEPHERFMSEMTRGETAIIEYYEPWYSVGQGRFEIEKLMIAYQPDRVESDYEFQQKTGFGESLPCHQNINCSLGGPWQDEKRGVVRIQVAYLEGIGYCSGSLINNTSNNGVPYVLSAFHCTTLEGFTPDYPMWRFDFNYEFPTCFNVPTEPVYSSLLGCSVVAGREESDFLLLQLNSFVPNTYNAYFNGWNNGTGVPDTGTLIHHPYGDVKKLSIDDDEGVIHPHPITWDNNLTTPSHHHFRAILDIGTMQGGSSGCPFFDQNGHIVGQLHGGNGSCSTFITYHGRLNKSWDEGSTPTTRLSDWLDPTGSGVTTLDGIEAPLAPSTASVEGSIQLENGNPLGNVEVQITGGISTSINNDPDGTYSAPNLIIGNNFTVTPTRNDSVRNEVTTFDMVLIRRHILGLAKLDSPYKIIAADVNKSETITTFDMVLIQKVILQLDNSFPNNTSWRFVPSDFVFPDPTDPFSSPFPEMIFIQPLSANMQQQNFTAIKVGNVN